MEAFVVNRESWHFRVVEFAGLMDPWNQPKDFCSYWRRVMFSLLFIGAATVLVVNMVSMIGMALYLMGNALVTDFWAALREAGMFAATLLGMGVAMFLIFVIIGFIGRGIGWLYTKIKSVWPKALTFKRRPRDPKSYVAPKKKEPSLLWMKYKAWKESYCPMVEYG